MSDFKDGLIEVDGCQLRLTNIDKVLWPDDGITKGDLIYYYYNVADFIVPHLENRPLTLKRYPNGIGEEPFYQKNADEFTPEWVETKSIFSKTAGEHIKYFICNNRATLIYLANLGTITQNPWLSHIPTLDKPDFFVIDLDPQEPSAFKHVIETAHLVKEELDKLNLKSWVKTSGATGIHIYVPIIPTYTYKQARTFAELIATLVNRRSPNITTIIHSVAQREGRVYIDYLQNVQGKTLASVYSVRARRGAPVSTPLEWDELTSDIAPEQFHMFNILERLKDKGDLFKGTLEVNQDLSKALE